MRLKTRAESWWFSPYGQTKTRKSTFLGNTFKHASHHTKISSLLFLPFNTVQVPDSYWDLFHTQEFWTLLRGQWHPTPVLFLGKSHGQRSLEGCSPQGCEESNTTERLHFHFSLSCIGEGNGNPLQCSCLENPGRVGPGGLPSMGSHRIGHDWSDLAAAAAERLQFIHSKLKSIGILFLYQNSSLEAK